MGRRRQNRRTIGSKENLRENIERTGILAKQIFRIIRPKEKGEDKISRLPDDLIHRILSLTDAKDAVQTSLLSTRWRNVWKSLSHLNFQRCIFRRITDFSKFVCEYLFHRDHRSDLSVLNLTCFEGVIQRSLLCKIISYGASHNLQQLNFCSKVCQLPPSVFTIQSLRQLSFETHFRGSINLFLKLPLDLPALTTLFFNRVLFELSGNDGAVNFFSKLPNLKNLTLFNCNINGLEVFYINSPQLENLYIKFTRVTPQVEFVISAPKLSSFKYIGAKPLLISANDLHCLDKVYLNIGMDRYNEKWKQNVCKEVVNMFHQLRDAKFVTVSLCTIELLSWVFELLKDQPSPFRYLECLQAYAREVDEHKRTLLLINKADLLPFSVREKWAKYFRLHGILFLFWSAKAASADLEGKNIGSLQETISSEESLSEDAKIYGREELLSRLQSGAEEIALRRRESNSESNLTTSKSVTVGFVGYPNVGKSSTINALVGEKRTGVTSTPGKTKHFQTLIISEKLMLCDCPGLVFPSFTSSRHEMIASGVLPIDRITENREAIQVVANRVPRKVIEEVYKISLPKPKPYEPQNRAPLASELLRAYCASRGYVASSGLPDETKAARQILKDYIVGKLPHFEMPPGSDDLDMSEMMKQSTHLLSEVAENSEGEEEEEEEEEKDEGGGPPSLERVLDDLTSFDMANGIAASSSEVRANRKKLDSNAAHKQHKKPQRKKDRAWRVKADGTDGTPIVRVFQKSINTGPVVVDG